MTYKHVPLNHLTFYVVVCINKYAFGFRSNTSKVTVLIECLTAVFPTIIH